jgi:7-cyano-7-deazaguanine reductase
MDPTRPSIKVADTRDEINAEDKVSILETFPFHPLHSQLIHLHTEEFLAICPGSGLPDIGVLDIWYIPTDKCLELKSLKYYLFSYKNDGIFQEPVTDLIFDHLWRVLEPQYLKVVLKYNIRGGIDTVVTVEKGTR